MKLNFLNIFRRPRNTEDILEKIPNPHEELVEMIFDFFNNNQDAECSTQFILSNSKSIVVPPYKELAYLSNSAYISVMDNEDEEFIIKLYDISAIGRVPRGKSCLEGRD